MKFQFTCPFISKEELWNRAEDVRTTYLQDNNLPIDSELICERAGLIIDPKDLPVLFDSCIIISRNMLYIQLKRYMDDRFENHLRLTFAHELGHFILHRPLLEELDMQTIDDYIGFFDTEKDETYSRFEYQADEFAGRLLVPTGQLQKRLEELINTLQPDQRSLVASNMECFKDITSEKICREFGVSKAVIAIRLEREGLWPPRL